MSRIERATVAEFLRDLADECPAWDEPWKYRDDWDPMHSLAEIRAAAKQGLIELDDTGDPETYRFRFTPKGRQKHAELWP